MARMSKTLVFAALVAMLALAHAGGSRHSKKTHPSPSPCYDPVATPSPSPCPVPVAVPSPCVVSPSPACEPDAPAKCEPDAPPACEPNTPPACEPNQPPICDPPPPPPVKPSPPPPVKPSPPPPFPPPPKAILAEGFPWCKCNRTDVSNLYRLNPTTSAATAGNFTRYCFSLTATVPPASATGTCARFDLRKIEFAIDSSCRFVRGLTFGADALASSFSKGPLPSLATFKIGRPRAALLGSLTSLAAGATPVCFELPPACSLTRFCRGPVCVASFFNSASNCCPVVNVNTR